MCVIHIVYAYNFSEDKGVHQVYTTSFIVKTYHFTMQCIKQKFSMHTTMHA